MHPEQAAELLASGEIDVVEVAGGTMLRAMHLSARERVLVVDPALSMHHRGKLYYRHGDNMQDYAPFAEKAFDRLRNAKPSHVFVCGHTAGELANAIPEDVQPFRMEVNFPYNPWGGMPAFFPARLLQSASQLDVVSEIDLTEVLQSALRQAGLHGNLQKVPLQLSETDATNLWATMLLESADRLCWHWQVKPQRGRGRTRLSRRIL